ncbi:myeloid differentiation primary response protein MyD88 isoform X2 [Ceratina calcarata]|uniref:Myeloid differentiation primary response protein MyD88 isoform X2 n=1 Tax=Ceratina calcarata TaxID=156304 RepID=A0AAJ7RWC9_9HYME|nr:myeloid differentiation primary response protein MyD88 isoform X2 [Ceratina calcarata]
MDWRGLAHLCKLSGELMPLLTFHVDPSVYILTVWGQNQKHITLKDFRTVLEEIERWDILDDTVKLFERDAKRYLEELEKAQASAEIIANDIDQKVLTVGDLHRLRQGLENQYYDAFLLYADEDTKFATEVVDKLENQYNLKLCLKDRDLIVGVTFEHEAIMTLISERCNRLIVIISPNFLNSSANKFFLNYAQALSIDKKQRKIVPCLYQKCKLPQQLNYMFILDYNRVGLYDFWGKLRDSVETPTRLGESLKVSLVTEDEYNNESKTDAENTKCAVSTEVQELELKNSSDKLNKAEIARHSEQSPLGNKKYGNFLQWPKKKYFTKTDNIKKDCTPPTETVSLPSLENIDLLKTSTESMEKKHKTQFINKYMKKVQLKKDLIKS